LCFQLADLKDVTAFDNLANLARIANVNQRIGVRNHEVGELLAARRLSREPALAGALPSKEPRV